ncbi:hypothetical protein ACGF07_32075 [Kitasatospora sp. NPDC048194]|uniref:hypothetical protein n=1 Tax=Kitasatospora sp. NPDC048194 TaxID=3364045 RepID=UPI003724635F
MTTARSFHRPTEADIAHLAKAEHPVILQLMTGHRGRVTPTGAVGTVYGPVLDLAVPAGLHEAGLTVELDVAAELAEAAVKPLHPWLVNAYQPKRGESAVRLVGSLVAWNGRVTAKLEFSDTAKRGPERRKLSALLAKYYGVSFDQVFTWHESYIDAGFEIDDFGRMRGISKREEVRHFAYGHGRTDARIWGAPAAVAKFVAVLPIVLEQFDILSLAWGKRVQKWLTTTEQGETYCMPRERRGTVTRARRDFAEALAFALGQYGSPNSKTTKVDPTKSLPYQSDAAAVETLDELGWWEWLEQWQRPETEAAYASCAELAERIAARIADERAKAGAAESLRRIEAELAEQRAAEEAYAADIEAALARVNTKPTAEQLAALAEAELAEAEEELGYREVPPCPVPPRVEEPETAEELRAQAAILVELGAPAAAQILLDRADALEPAEEAAEAEELLPSVEADQEPAEQMDVDAVIEAILAAGTPVQRPLVAVEPAPASGRRPRRRRRTGADLFPGVEWVEFTVPVELLDHVPTHLFRPRSSAELAATEAAGLARLGTRAQAVDSQPAGAAETGASTPAERPANPYQPQPIPVLPGTLPKLVPARPARPAFTPPTDQLALAA